MKYELLCGAAAIGLLGLAGCDAQPNSRQQENAAAEASQEKLLASTPVPILPLSQERENLVKRAKRINVQNMSSCVTLFTRSGAVAGFFPVAGKVSSLNSYLLPSDRAVSYGTNVGVATIEAPDIDGAYGKNADAIFFFTADTDAYVEWSGDYFWSDQCLTPSTQPLLVRRDSQK